MAIGPASRLILYTDGLVEDRGSSIDAGLEALREAAADGPSDPEALCGSIVAALGREGGADDDVTLLVAGTASAPPHPLKLVIPANPDSLRGMRIRLGAWLEGLGATPSELQDIQLASHEACCNSMEHGYDFGDRTLELQATQHDGGVSIVVIDEGRWREPTGRDRGRGRGIDLMGQLMGEVDVAHGEDGHARGDEPRAGAARLSGRYRTATRRVTRLSRPSPSTSRAVEDRPAGAHGRGLRWR